MTDAYFNECLGCGLDYDGNTLNADVDGTSITSGPNGLASGDSLLGDFPGLINDTGSQTFPWDDDCNGLHFDCEDGTMWYNTRPCHLNKGGGGIIGTAVKNVSQTDGTRNDTFNLGDTGDGVVGPCYDGMKRFTIGSMKVQATFENPNLTYGQNDNYSIHYEFNLRTASEGVVCFNSIDEDFASAAVQIRKIKKVHTIPFVVCTTIGEDLNWDLIYELETDFQLGVHPYDMTFSYYATFQSFIAKEC